MDNYCPNCSKKFAKNDDFCSKCGNERNWVEENYDDDYDEDSSSTDYPFQSKLGPRYRIIPCRKCLTTGRGSLFFNKCRPCDGSGHIIDFEN